VRLLVDEGVPVQVLEPLRRNKGREFLHIHEEGWDGRKDRFLFDHAKRRGFDALIALDVDQLAEPVEWRALKTSGLHHVSLRQGRSVSGRTGLARVMGSLIVAMPYVLADLELESEQRIVEIRLLSATSRHTLYDPRREQVRYPYWR
jgi:PIN like domain